MCYFLTLINISLIFSGLCSKCVVPMKSCALCNAYKTVYGNASYLQHRLQKKLSTQSSESANNLLQSDSSGDDSLYESSLKRAGEGSAVHQGKSSNGSSPRNVSSSRRTKDGLRQMTTATPMIEDQDGFKGGLDEVTCNPSALFAHLPTSTPFAPNTKKKIKMKEKQESINLINKPSIDQQIQRTSKDNIRRRRRSERNNIKDCEDDDLEVRELQLSDTESDRETGQILGKPGDESTESSSPDKERASKQHGSSSYEDEEDLTSPPVSPRDFDVTRRIVRTVDAREKLSYSDESQRIHNRIKELMRKNESVLVISS